MTPPGRRDPKPLPSTASSGDDCQPGRRRRTTRRRRNTLGSYRLLDVLGEGGAGRVFLAEHNKLGRRVALKVPLKQHLDDPEMLHRFFLEARTVNRIRHRNVVEITDIVEEGARPFIVMELLDGTPLDRWIRQPAFADASLTTRLSIASQICAGLAAAHSAGVVHRDLKPGNVMLVGGPSTPETVKLLDFGAAKLRPTASGSRAATEVGTIIGTPGFMAPEQMAGAEVDARIDVYAFGVLAYHLFAGAPPFRAKSIGDLVLKHLKARPRPMRRRKRLPCRIPAELDRVVLRCLEKEPESRPQSIEEVGNVIDCLLARERYALITAAPRRDSDGSAPPRRPTLSQWLRPRRWLVASAVGTALLAGMGAGLAMTVSFERERTARAGSTASAAGGDPVVALAVEPAPAPNPASEFRLTPSVVASPCGRDYRNAMRLFEQRKVVLAIKALERCTARDPRHAAAFRALGIAQTVLGRPTRANRAFERFLQLAPSHVDAPRVRRIVADEKRRKARRLRSR